MDMGCVRRVDEDDVRLGDMEVDADRRTGLASRTPAGGRTEALSA